MALQVGAESKPKLYAAIGLGAVVLIIAIIQVPKFFGGSAPAPVTPPAPVAVRPATPAAEPSTVEMQGATAYPHEAIQLPSASALDPTLHPELMAQAEDTTYTGNGRNIFSPNSAAPTPVNIEKPKNFRPGPPPPPPGPPPPPTIDLKFYGYSSVQGGNREIFLLHGDDIFLAHEGDVVDRRYRVVAIRPFSVEIEDIPYHNTQSLPLSQN
ncbi:MAG TPA: hypothetical protein VGM02_14815 [Acidobacteriaceae bacterium]|jgi:hypothetical protein